MKTKTVCTLIVLFALILAVPAYAQPLRTVTIQPGLSFSGTQATCSLEVYANSYSDEISARIVLKRGASTVASWEVDDVGDLIFSDTVSVSKNATYTLTAYVSINGNSYPPSSVTKTNI